MGLCGAGFLRSLSEDCESSRLPLRELHAWHDEARLVYEWPPPLERGTTWSIVVATRPQ